MNRKPLVFAIGLILLTACNTQIKQQAATPTETDQKDQQEISSVEVSGSRTQLDSVTKVDVEKKPRDKAEPVMARRASADMSAPVIYSPVPAAPLAEPEMYLAQTKSADASQIVSGNINAYAMPQQPEQNTEKYKNFSDNPIQLAAETPVSTFSIDVDTGSYSNVRRMLNSSTRPPADSVRAEEIINYFDFGYTAPNSRKQPFLVTTEISPAPWNTQHELMLVGIKGYEIARSEIPAANIVFLIDTSGSMSSQDKLPLLIASFKEMVSKLRPQDRVSIVVYAGSAGLVLPATSGEDKATILRALDKLQAGGSTNGGQGIALAYKVAKDNFISNGVNRVILATDGDFNVGISNTEMLKTLVTDQRKSGIALTTLGFGQGNYNDEMAEQLADVGNGNHAYIDNLNEGRKVLVEEMSSTMMTIAQDVKIQVEFNPAVVAEYRLIGYENRKLNREDFNNDKIDAGDIGAGHDVTALYEITLVGSGGESVSPLRYGRPKLTASGLAGEIALLKLRYKQPGAEQSQLIQKPMMRSSISAKPSERMKLAASLAAYADLLRGGKNSGDFSWNDVKQLAASVSLPDSWGYRAEFLGLIDHASRLTENHQVTQISE
jgi:Ca-activated chloride channel homolog